MPSVCCPWCGASGRYAGKTLTTFECGSAVGKSMYSDRSQSDICNRLCEQLKRINQLECVEAIHKTYRELPDSYHQGMLELLVRCAFECGEISHGRAAELLKENVQTFRERGWNQQRYRDTGEDNE